MDTATRADRLEAPDGLERSINGFIVQEARLADGHRYEEWEALWADDPDCLYWVPAAGEQDPASKISYIYDNRARIRTRVRQLTTDQHYPLEPPPHLTRVVGNVEIGPDASGRADVWTVNATFVLVEFREIQTLWAGALTYHIKAVDGALRLLMKKVELVNRDGFLPTFAFLI